MKTLFVMSVLSISLGIASETPVPQLYSPVTIGDPAPPIQIREWVKGPPVSALEKGKVYVLDFWSTWCVPCLSAMPETTALQRKYPEVIVLGLTSLDQFGNTEAAVKKIVASKGDAIGFRIGIDAESESAKGYQGVFKGRTVEAYLGGAKIPAIPATFIIDKKGRVAFIGNPLEIDDVVAKCLDETWDLNAARAQRATRIAAQQTLSDLEKVIEAKSTEKALELCKRLVDDLPHKEARIFAAVAEMMADNGGELAKQAPALATRAAQHAVDLTKEKDPGTISALAGVYFAEGEIDQAITTMTRAAEMAEGGLKPVLEKKVQEFRAARKKQN